MYRAEIWYGTEYDFHKWESTWSFQFKLDLKGPGFNLFNLNHDLLLTILA